MKKCVLLALTVLGFTSLSNAAPKDLSLTCDNGRAMLAFLDFNSQGEAIASLRDNYDVAQYSIAHRRLGLQCKEVGASIECEGNWDFEQRPANVVFTPDSAGKYIATFARSPAYSDEVLTVACEAH